MQTALIGLISALVGAWVGAAISRRTSNDLYQDQAMSEFRDAFNLTLSSLHMSHAQDPGFAREQLDQHYEGHLRAYIRTRASLNSKQRAKLDKRWSVYVQAGSYEIPEEQELYRFADTLMPDTTEEQNKLAIRKINALLGVEP